MSLIIRLWLAREVQGKKAGSILVRAVQKIIDVSRGGINPPQYTSLFVLARHVPASRRVPEWQARAPALLGQSTIL